MNRLLTALAAAAALWGCTSQNIETSFANQESRIDAYINNLTLQIKDQDGNVIEERKPEVVHHKGSNRVIINDGEGEALSAGGSVTFFYAGYVFTSSPSSLFATHHKETAESSGWTITDPDYNAVTLDLNDKNITEGLRNGLAGTRAGEECMIIFSGKYGLGKKRLGAVPANSALCYHIWVESIKN